MRVLIVNATIQDGKAVCRYIFEGDDRWQEAGMDYTGEALDRGPSSGTTAKVIVTRSQPTRGIGQRPAPLRNDMRPTWRPERSQPTPPNRRLRKPRNGGWSRGLASYPAIQSGPTV